MNMVTDDVRAKYKALRAKASEALEAAKPARQAYNEAMRPYREIIDKMEELVTGDVAFCDGCQELIFDGDRKSSTVEGHLCAQCSPTYDDMLKHPELFVSQDDEDGFMTADEAKRICAAHVAAGGSLSDSMAR